MSWRSGKETLPGVPFPGRPGSEGPERGCGDASAEARRRASAAGAAGPHWHVEAVALPAAFGVGAAFRCELLAGHVVIDECPHWHPGKIRRCEHVEDMEQLASTRESLRRQGACGVRS